MTENDRIKIIVSVFGKMKTYVSSDTTVFYLHKGAALKDLLEEIHSAWGDVLPESVWHRSRKKFRGPVIIMSGDEVLRDPATVLEDNQEVKLYRFIAGG